MQQLKQLLQIHRFFQREVRAQIIPLIIGHSIEVPADQHVHVDVEVVFARGSDQQIPIHLGHPVVGNKHIRMRTAAEVLIRQCRIVKAERLIALIRQNEFPGSQECFVIVYD